jgi:hypothetical protein
LSALESVDAPIREYDAEIEKLAKESYPEVALLKSGAPQAGPKVWVH